MMRNNETQYSKVERLILMYGDNCWWCGDRLAKETRTIEHLVRKVDGGTNEFSNLRLACCYCNQGRGTASVPWVVVQKGRDLKARIEQNKQVDPPWKAYAF